METTCLAQSARTTAMLWLPMFGTFDAMLLLPIFGMYDDEFHLPVCAAIALYYCCVAALTLAGLADWFTHEIQDGHIMLLGWQAATFLAFINCMIYAGFRLATKSTIPQMLMTIIDAMQRTSEQITLELRSKLRRRCKASVILMIAVYCMLWVAALSRWHGNPYHLMTFILGPMCINWVYMLYTVCWVLVCVEFSVMESQQYIDTLEQRNSFLQEDLAQTWMQEHDIANLPSSSTESSRASTGTPQTPLQQGLLAEHDVENIPVLTGLASTTSRAFLLAASSEAGSEEAQPKIESMWLPLLVAYNELHRVLSNIWQNAAPALIVTLLNFASSAGFFALMYILLANHDYWSALLALAFGSWNSGLFIAVLFPLAQVTDRCRDRVRALVTSMAPIAARESDEMKYMFFVQHIDRMPTGVFLPVFGDVSFKKLGRLASALSAGIPTAIAYVSAATHNATHNSTHNATHN